VSSRHTTKKGDVDDLETGCVVPVAGEGGAELRPDLLVLCGEDADGAPCDLLGRGWVFLYGERVDGFTSDLSAYLTMAWRLRRTSRSVRTGLLLSSTTSNQSVNS
jgi:hypothetical protein